MPDPTPAPSSPLQFRLPAVAGTGSAAAQPPPAILRETSRSTTLAQDPFINDAVVSVAAVYELLSPSRSDATPAMASAKQGQLLALETEDGSTLFISAARLQERLQTLYPEAIDADSVIDLGKLRDREGASRGLGDWVWSKLSILNLSPDRIVEEAQKQLLKLAEDALQDQLGKKYRAELDLSLSWVGAKALMWAVESRLTGDDDRQGLYRWHDQELATTDYIRPDDPALQQAVRENKPILLFIHGTASSTMGSFGGLSKHGGQDWEALQRQFGGHVYGFEHRTFSASPIDNALLLANSLPAGARLAIVTHSRGGLVGDLLCTGRLDERLIQQYQRIPRPDKKEINATQRELNQQFARQRDSQEQQQLRELSALLEQKNFRIERYLRVACPAGGTPLLSDNLDLFLSGLLSLMNWLVGSFTGALGNAMLSAFKRIVLEIANRRYEAHMVPGIEAMLVDAPMGKLLATAPRRPGVKMAVIAGDMNGGHPLKRLALMFTNWMFFDQQKNDLVVDTLSMFAGLARQTDTLALLDQGQEVNHFRYFNNPFTRKALHDWLAESNPQRSAGFGPLNTVQELGQLGRSATGQGHAPAGKRPVVVILPDFMGSHLATQGGQRLWLDMEALTVNGIENIRLERKGVVAEAVVELFYGQLIADLQATHDVVAFPYDWRQPLANSAAALAEKLAETLTSSGQQPVHLLAHGMGGLVARATLSGTQGLWECLVSRGGRLLMLGVPQQGCYLPVSTLLGKSSVSRKLARLAGEHLLPDMLAVLGAYPGLLALLPRNGVGGSAPDYSDPATWRDLLSHNRDPWFGDGLGVELDAQTLQAASHDVSLSASALPHSGQMICIVGQAAATDCGIREQGGRLQLLATDGGDGVVTWQSATLAGLPDSCYWLMPVEHGVLTDTPEYFPAIRELLESGETGRLVRGLPGSSRGNMATHAYEPGPEAYPSAEEFMRGIYNGEPRYQPVAGKLPGLEISVRAMDLRFAQLPVMCGHYAVDAISGAESIIDEYIVNGALRQRERLGVYADDVGSSTIVLNQRSDEEKHRGTGKGAVIIGLGDWSKISTQRITEAVAEGVLNFLLHNLENGLVEDGGEATVLSLNSLLIGHNSTTHISVEASVDAIVRGVCEANQRFNRNTRSKLWVGKLEFVELYRDTAITAAYAVRYLPGRMEKEFQRYQIAVRVTDTLSRGKGMRACLGGHMASGYWPRLIVTNDRPEQRDTSARKPAEFIKYVFLSERARAEGVVQQRQPDLIERLIAQSLCSSRYNRDVARTLFQLMIPLDFKAVARETSHLLLVVDADTANLPWEMIQADDEPLVLRVSMVRQLVSMRFRRSVTSTVQRSACVIGNPSSAGFYAHFHTDDSALRGQGLQPLPGAAREAAAIRTILNSAPQGYEVEALYPHPATAEPHHQALDVFNALYKRPYRILTIAAHGVVDAQHQDGRKRTGVVLSDGLLLTAAEIGQMEVVPELVFLNCCHLAVISGGEDGKLPEPAGSAAAGTQSQPVAYNRLAYSLAQELIEIGVRCVVAAGWAVNDGAATTFAETFFHAFVNEQRAFGEAVHQARKKTYELDQNCNTWGAYQAYGDPAYVLDAQISRADDERAWNPVDPEELVLKLEKLRMDANRKFFRPTEDAYRKTCTSVRGLLQRSPPAWQKLAAVQFAIGNLYAEYVPNPESFQQAQAAYQAAINGVDSHGGIPVKALEQLANLEARASVEVSGVDAHRLVESAINRVTGLLEVTESIQVKQVNGLKQVVGGDEANGGSNAERWALLGSAWKRKAVLRQRSGSSWPQIAKALQQSRDAYLRVEGNIDDPDCNFYAMINRLQLDGLLLGDADGDECRNLGQQASRCLELTRKRFAHSYDFFDAVMPVDAQVAVHLLIRPLAVPRIGALANLYRDAVRSVHSSDRQFDSVVRQLKLFAELLPARKGVGDRELARVLAEAVMALEQEV